jgi:dihydroorotate dehydrogenase (NAD+) catalytic subunit
MVDLSVTIAGLKLKNPVMTASGTFGFGLEFADFFDIGRLGAVVVKGTTLEPREGNAPVRMAETSSGMLNAVGLQNKGVDYLIRETLPQLAQCDVPVIVNVNGSTVEEYLAVIEKLNPTNVAAYELNISCPNVKHGGMMFGVDPQLAAGLVAEAKRKAKKPLIVKLSPNVTDIVSIAKAVEAAGADAISLINTLLGMAIDYKTRKPAISTVTAGLSGPAVKPVALRMVWQVAQTVKIPVIGMGGISTWEDALEFFLAGASAVAVGTANFVNPKATIEIIQGLSDYFQEQKISRLADYIDSLQV